ncbi:MAG: four helix bundle protein [Prolixibacteraceae bacterium]|nr:four helix bundle protein [Prolixibacteraceae bacterium]
MYKSFTEMPVWQKAHDLSLDVYNLTVNLPRSEDYSLTSQIRRASSSVPANISEAFGRQTKKDKSNFYVIARGSAFETQNHLIYGKSVGYFEGKIVESYLTKYTDLIFEINKIINSLS